MGKKLKDTASEFEKLEAIKKLCDELTAENSKLLQENDILKEEVKSLQVNKYELIANKLGISSATVGRVVRRDGL